MCSQYNLIYLIAVRCSCCPATPPTNSKVFGLLHPDPSIQLFFTDIFLHYILGLYCVLCVLLHIVAGEACALATCYIYHPRQPAHRPSVSQLRAAGPKVVNRGGKKSPTDSTSHNYHGKVAQFCTRSSESVAAVKDSYQSGSATKWIWYTSIED